MAILTGEQGKLYRISTDYEVHGLPAVSSAVNEGRLQLKVTAGLDQHLKTRVILDETKYPFVLSWIIAQEDYIAIRNGTKTAHFTFSSNQSGRLAFPNQEAGEIQLARDVESDALTFQQIFEADGYYEIPGHTDPGFYTHGDDGLIYLNLLSDSEGAGYFIYKLEVRVVTEQIPKDRWYQLLSRNSILSIFDERIPLQGIMNARENISVRSDDPEQGYNSARVLTLTLVAAVKGIDLNASREKYDVTKLSDVYTSYITGEIVEQSGSIEGLFDSDDLFVRALISHFNHVIVGKFANDSLVGVKATPMQEEVHRFMLSRNTKGDRQKRVWHYLPMIIDSFSAEKPMRDVQTIRFDYTLDGSSFPHTIILNAEDNTST